MDREYPAQARHLPAYGGRKDVARHMHRVEVDAAAQVAAVRDSRETEPAGGQEHVDLPGMVEHQVRLISRGQLLRRWVHVLTVTAKYRLVRPGAAPESLEPLTSHNATASG